MNKKENFIAFVKATLGEKIYNESGTLLYSPFNTLKKGKYLILGLNPGGDPEKKKETILEKLENTKLNGISEYLTDWNNGKKHRLQENMKAIAEKLNFNLSDVCSTNLFFTRTKDEKKLHWNELDESLKVHEEIISRVNPEVIIIFGVVPFDEYYKFLSKKLKLEIEDLKDEESGHGKWMIRNFIAHGKQKIRVIGLPHLSVYTIYNRPHILAWLKKEVENNRA